MEYEYYNICLFLRRRAVKDLLVPGAAVDQTMRVGRSGFSNIIKDHYSEWSLQNDGNFLKNLKHRGVNNVTALPGYHYRDDGKLLWVALQKYVQTSIRSYYGKLSLFKCSWLHDYQNYIS